MKKSQKQPYPKIIKSAATFNTTTSKKKKSSRKKALAWFIGGILIIVALGTTAITIGTAMNNNGSAERADRDTLNVANGDGEEIETKYYHIGDNKFFIKIPDNFHTLTSAEINKKYSGDVPDGVFANSDNTVNVAISLSNAEVKNEQIEEYLDVMIELLSSTGKILKSDFYEVNRHNVATIKVETENDDEKYYNHMMFFSYDDKLVAIAFNCKLNERETWEKVGDFIIDSLYFEK